jgi:hypothetical protein
MGVINKETRTASKGFMDTIVSMVRPVVGC